MQWSNRKQKQNQQNKTPSIKLGFPLPSVQSNNTFTLCIFIRTRMMKNTFNIHIISLLTSMYIKTELELLNKDTNKLMFFLEKTTSQIVIYILVILFIKITLVGQPESGCILGFLFFFFLFNFFLIKWMHTFAFFSRGWSMLLKPAVNFSMIS